MTDPEPESDTESTEKAEPPDNDKVGIPLEGFGRKGWIFPL